MVNAMMKCRAISKHEGAGKCKLLAGKSKGKRPLEGIDLNRKIILKWILEKNGGGRV
jgi:hypothetical protein